MNINWNHYNNYYNYSNIEQLNPYFIPTIQNGMMPRSSSILEQLNPAFFNSAIQSGMMPNGTRNRSTTDPVLLNISDGVFMPHPHIIIPEKKEGVNKISGECPVCYDTKDILCYYKCKHHICDSCYTEWIKCKTSCPICRSV